MIQTTIPGGSAQVPLWRIGSASTGISAPHGKTRVIGFALASPLQRDSTMKAWRLIDFGTFPMMPHYLIRSKMSGSSQYHAGWWLA
jgi:hypothetical protein